MRIVNQPCRPSQEHCQTESKAIHRSAKTAFCRLIVKDSMLCAKSRTKAQCMDGKRLHSISEGRLDMMVEGGLLDMNEHRE